MSFKITAVLFASLLVLAGCDQAEKSAQQLMGKAAESAKQALSDATGGLISKKESTEKESEKTESSSQEI